MPEKKIAIIGGGAAGLMAADMLSRHGEVHIYEKGKALGRKFLVAGNGGFNLTNSAEGEDLCRKYTPMEFLQPALEAFNSQDTRTWLAGLGIPTFVGSSGRVFPEKGIKPITVLQQIKDRLLQNGVQFHFQHEFVGFNAEQKPILKFQESECFPEADHYLFALGGASWPVTGSTGNWLEAFRLSGIKTLAFQSSNCGINVNWPDDFRNKFGGAPLKNLQVSAGNFSLKGEALITDYGLEGNVIYPLVPKIRELLQAGKEAFLTLDFKPQNTVGQLLEKVRGKQIQTKNYEQVFKLSKAQLTLLKAFSSKEDYVFPENFVRQIKQLTIPVSSLRPIEEAISTAGGISLEEVNPDFTLKAFPHISVVGEMLDWDAPTGGFLLQGCFSTAYLAAQAILVKLR
ncbi:TIGR03862 family flavoprotein [Adhaeribacter sp. BT258]|uniref:TIGR03862 family flavoprotein n=1 Tax=Adhaeribacter terrigena TaxID=2793070 RepID=A0ABS1BZG8_9BACT|nr:TIGR03862 family flavoprotein [Adhaeribacter terrigena]MBK0402527.1 TIGR03862 family flavoprotein [Adhaeribacter terrigena]